jgi:hypothetical protein
MLFYYFNGRSAARTCRHFGITRQTSIAGWFDRTTVEQAHRLFRIYRANLTQSKRSNCGIRWAKSQRMSKERPVNVVHMVNVENGNGRGVPGRYNYYPGSGSWSERGNFTRQYCKTHSPCNISHTCSKGQRGRFASYGSAWVPCGIYAVAY